MWVLVSNGIHCILLLCFCAKGVPPFRNAQYCISPSPRQCWCRFRLWLLFTSSKHYYPPLQYSCEIEGFAGTQKFKLCATPGVLRDEHVLIKCLGWWLPLVLARTEGQEGDSKAFSLQLPCAWKLLKLVLTGVQSAGCGTDHRFYVYLIPGMYLG